MNDLTPGVPVTPDKLSDLMDFDHVIRVHPNGTVTEPAGVYAPELDGETPEPGWRLLAGYTGQYGYNGPIMHSSEFIGGRLARDILDTPGLYVALVVESHDPDEPCEWFVNNATIPSWCCNTHMYDGTGDFPATDNHPDECPFIAVPSEPSLDGWAVAYRETDDPLCGWYALCLNYAIGTAEHAILGPVPICRRCAEKHDLTITTH
jgi:hypothetical protein